MRISDWSSDVCSSDLTSLSMAEAARISGLNRPSTGRCLFTLVRLGYVRERGGRYMLTPGLLPLACGFLTSTPLASASQAIANALRDRLQETISVGALDPADPGRIQIGKRGRGE